MDELGFWLSKLAQAQATGTTEGIQKAEDRVAKSIEKRGWNT